MAKKSKNLEKVQSYLDGTYGGKIQSGYTPTEETRKVGDIWTDSDGMKWEQKKGYRVKLTKLASAGIAEQCSDCEKYITKPWDKEIFKFNDRCYYCQLDYEVELKTKPLRWFAYRRLKDLQNMKSIEKDMEQWIDELEKIKQENPFDMSVANALANGNVEMSLNKNKVMTN